MTTLTTAIARINKRAYYYFNKQYSVPASTVTKYPIFLESLIQRIKLLKSQYSITSPLRLFDLSKPGVKGVAQRQLRGKGGVYCWWCKPTGLFYVGSAMRFFDNKGRLNDYFMPSRVNISLAGPSTKVSKDLAAAIHAHGINSFVLLILEETSSSETSRSEVTNMEQFWMLLRPTLNRSLAATSSSFFTMLESTRENMSNIIHQYQLVDGVFVGPTITYGMKELCRKGVISVDGTILKMQYNNLKGLLNTQRVWKDTFVFSLKELTLEELVTLADSHASMQSQPVVPPKSKTKGVWVYDASTKAFLSYENMVTSCMAKYGISKTHLQHVRKSQLPFEGKFFSNIKLH